MSKLLDDIDQASRPVFFELIARAAEAVGPVAVITTQRTPDEQVAAVAAGRSATLQSRHLRWVDQGGILVRDDARGASFAIDLCPWEVWQAHGPDKLAWPVVDPRWKLMALVGKRLGLRCGIDWHWPGDPNFWDHRDPSTVNPFDPGHFERPFKLVRP